MVSASKIYKQSIVANINGVVEARGEIVYNFGKG